MAQTRNKARAPQHAAGLRIWHFQCPDCGLGHEEVGVLLTDDELVCEICRDTDGITVRLRRWHEEV